MRNLNKLGILLCTFVSLQMTSFAQNPYVTYSIPHKTLQIAREAQVQEIKNKPTSQVVKVGIADTGFKNYLHSNIGIYGTAQILIFNDNLLIKEIPAYTNINIKLNNEKLFELSFDDGTKIATIIGPIHAICPNGLLGVKNLKRAGSTALYHGAFEVVKINDKFNLVNMVEVEEYLKGVVPNEMPVRFGLEALKAQSVAARNYVLSPRTKASKNYDVVDSVASQVYYGANTEKAISNQAVKETEGVVAIYDGNLILAQYSSTAGGYTESYSNAFSDPITKVFPSNGKHYLTAKPDIIAQEALNDEEKAYNFYTSKPDSYDIRSPYYRWQREWNVQELHDVLEKNLPTQSATGFVHPAFSKGEKLGELKDLRVKKRGESGKIMELEIVTDKGNYKVFKELVIRRLMTKDGKAMPSANMVFDLSKDTNDKLQSIKAYGGGFGHGVGMSQFGAGFMGSELNMPYYKILQHYYTGITLATKPIILSGNSSNNVVMQHFYTDKKYAKIMIDNKNNLSKLIINLNGVEKIIELPTSILSGKRFTEIDISNSIKKGRNEIVFCFPTSEDSKKTIKLYIELVEKDDNNIW